jgi:hypothetical protein
MQIHELTQPRKSQLDEAGILNKLGGMAKNAAGAVGDATGINRAIDTVTGIAKNPSSLISSRGLGRAQQYTNNKQAARAAARLGKQGYTGEGPTLGQSLEKFRQNPAAQQWVNSIVAKWPAQAQKMPKSATPATPVNEDEPVYLPGSKKPLDPNNPQDAQVLAAMSKQGLTAPVTTKSVSAIPRKRKRGTTAPATPSAPTYADEFRNWVNQQLKTVSLDTLEQDSKVKTMIDPLIDIVVANQNNLPAQQKAIAQLLSVAVAANHVVQKQSGSSMGSGYGSVADNTNAGIPLDSASDLKLRQELRNAGVRRLRSTRNPAVDGMFQKLGITIIP